MNKDEAKKAVDEGKKVRPVGAKLNENAKYLHFLMDNYLNDRNEPDSVEVYDYDQWEIVE